MEMCSENPPPAQRLDKGVSGSPAVGTLLGGRTAAGSCVPPQPPGGANPVLTSNLRCAGPSIEMANLGPGGCTAPAPSCSLSRPLSVLDEVSLCTLPSCACAWAAAGCACTRVPHCRPGPPSAVHEPMLCYAHAVSSPGCVQAHAVPSPCPKPSADHAVASPCRAKPMLCQARAMLRLLGLQLVPVLGRPRLCTSTC